MLLLEMKGLKLFCDYFLVSDSASGATVLVTEGSRST